MVYEVNKENKYSNFILDFFFEIKTYGCCAAAICSITLLFLNFACFHFCTNVILRLIIS